MTILYEKSDYENKTNYWPITVLPSLSKVYEKILHKQPNLLFVRGIAHSMLYLSSFHRQKCLDRSGVVGTISLQNV